MSASSLAFNKKSTNVRASYLKLIVVRLILRLMAVVAPQRAARLATQLFLSPRRFPRPEREQEMIARAERSTFTVRGQRLAAWSWGQGASVLLVHGWEGRGTQLSAFVDPLVAAGYRVVTFDGPGHGESEGRRSSLVELSEAIAAIAATLPDLQAIIAHSMGAAATTVAIERHGLSAQRLIYIAPPADQARYLRYFVKIFAIPPAMAQAIEQHLEEIFGIPISALNGPAHAPTMTLPLLVMHDRNDVEVRWEDGHALVTAWPDAQLISTEGLGHRRILRSERVIASVLEFITAPTRRAA